LNRLGAIARKYLTNLYGLTTSPLHRGLPTDRLWAEWRLDSARVVAAVSGVRKELETVAATIALPGELEAWKLSDTAAVEKVQKRIREEFAGWFARGYAAVGMRKAAGGAEYLLAPWSDF